MKTAVISFLLVVAMGAGVWSLRKPPQQKSKARVALAGGVYTTEPPGIVGLYEVNGQEARFTMCDTGEVYAVEGGDETMGKLQLAYRSLRVQASDGIVAELYGSTNDKKPGIFEAQGIRSVHPRLDGECVTLKPTN